MALLARLSLQPPRPSPGRKRTVGWCGLDGAYVVYRRIDQGGRLKIPARRRFSAFIHRRPWLSQWLALSFIHNRRGALWTPTNFGSARILQPSRRFASRSRAWGSLHKNRHKIKYFYGNERARVKRGVITHSYALKSSAYMKIVRD